jgi:hypothetical protein
VPPSKGATTANVKRTVVAAKSRTSKAEIRHEGREGLLINEAEALRENAGSGGIVEELLQRTPMRKGQDGSYDHASAMCALTRRFGSSLLAGTGPSMPQPA